MLSNCQQVISLVFGVVILVNPTVPHSFVGNRISYGSFENSPLKSLKLQHEYVKFNSQQDYEKIRTEDIIARFGYPVEMHEVTTDDGYILTMHRIPHGRNSSAFLPRRKPVLFQHGGFGDSFSWFFNHPDKATALILADLGYDIWLANARGTTYSRKHLYLNEYDGKFFDFSIDEIARYDIPAQIDYILNIAGEPKLTFVGISLAPPEVHMTLSLFPEYNQKLSLIASLAPTVYGSKTFPHVKILNIFRDPLTILKKVLHIVSSGTGEFPPFLNVKLTRTWGAIFGEACQSPMIGYFCQKLSKLLYGVSAHPDKMKLIPLAMSKALAPISTRMVDQFIEWLRTDRFQQYDFGAVKNVRVYGTTQPPLYHLKDTTTPVAVFYIENDRFVGPADVARLVSELPNIVLFHRIDSKSWDHLDFLTGHDVNELFTNHLIDLLQKY